jgi:hypothetical protein
LWDGPIVLVRYLLFYQRIQAFASHSKNTQVSSVWSNSSSSFSGRWVCTLQRVSCILFLLVIILITFILLRLIIMWNPVEPKSFLPVVQNEWNCEAQLKLTGQELCSLKKIKCVGDSQIICKVQIHWMEIPSCKWMHVQNVHQLWFLL